MKNRRGGCFKNAVWLVGVLSVLILTPGCSDWIEGNTSSGGGESSLTATASGGVALDAETLENIRGVYMGNATVDITGEVGGVNVGVDEEIALTITIADDGTITVTDGDKFNATAVLEETTFQVSGKLDTDYCDEVDIATAGSIANNQITGTITGSGVCGLGSLGYPISLSGNYVFDKQVARALTPAPVGKTFGQVLDSLQSKSQPAGQ